MRPVLKFFTLIATAMSTAACAIVPKNEVVTETRIHARPEQVWSVLTDGKKYSEWNPFIRDMQGEIEKGNKLKNTIEPSPGNQMIFKPTILEATPNKELRWRGRTGISGVFDGEHYFLLEPDNDGTRFIHGETFSGFALWFINTDKFKDNFEAMNEALSDRLLFMSENDMMTR